MDYSEVVQFQLKTANDLRHCLQTHGRARHILHNTERDWWWFCDRRTPLLEFVFNSGTPVSFSRCTKAVGLCDWGWQAVLESDENRLDMDLSHINDPSDLSIDDLNDIFWSDFLDQDLGAYAYWDIDHLNNNIYEYIDYREMNEEAITDQDPSADAGCDD
ncbi:MAG: hypothetical protein PVH30_06765 [Desulfobacterales bacterium]|jgi:hypothetical protein